MIRSLIFVAAILTHSLAFAFDETPVTRLLPVAGQGFVEVSLNQASQNPSLNSALANVVEVLAPDPGRNSSSKGSGVYLGDRYVLTAWHVIKDLNGGGGTVVFRDRGVVPYRVYLSDGLQDQALLEISTPHPTLVGVEMELANPVQGQQVYSAGFGRGFRVFGGPVRGFASNSGGQSEWLFHHNGAVPGDSGGPVFTTAGRLLGCLWGSANNQTYGTTPSRTAVFVKPLFPRLAQWRANRIAGKIAGIAIEPGCSTGQCPPSIGGSRPVQAIPDPVPSDGEMQLNFPNGKPGPPGPAGPQGERGPAGVDGKDGVDGQSVTTEQLAAIAAAITQQLKNDPSLKGPKGDRGEAGSITDQQLAEIKRQVLAEIKFPDRRIMLVDGSTGEVIDDETYKPGEPIVLDFQRVINAARRR